MLKYTLAFFVIIPCFSFCGSQNLFIKYENEQLQGMQKDGEDFLESLENGLTTQIRFFPQQKTAIVKFERAIELQEFALKVLGARNRNNREIVTKQYKALLKAAEDIIR